MGIRARWRDAERSAASLMPASWNRITGWLKQVEALRQPA